MGPRGQDMERLVTIALVAIVLGLALPAYAKVVRAASASGVELSWLQAAGLFALTLVGAAVALVLGTLLSGAALGAAICGAEWLAGRVRRERKP